MVKHIVMFKLNDTSVEMLNKTKEILLSMRGKVPMLKSIEVGIDSLKTSRSYDVVLTTTFDDFNELECYQNDPYHCDVVKKHMHAVRSSSVAVDYEI